MRRGGVTVAAPVAHTLLSRRWPLLGDLAAFHSDATGFLLHIAREQGDVARFRLGPREAVLFSHPDMIRTVLVERPGDFTKGGLMQRARRLLGNGLLTSEGEAHRAQRRRIQPAFSREQLRGYSALVPALAADHSAQWRNGTRVRVDAAMDALTMRAVASTLLGTDIQDELPSLGEALRLLARWAPFLIAPGGRVLEHTRLPVVGRIRKALEVVESVIGQRLLAGKADTALIGALLNGDASAPISPRLARDQVMTTFLAGYDTTSAALTWIWLLLGSHPAAESRLHRELAAVLQGQDPRADDLDSLPYTEMVVKEALRLYPPIGRIGRRPRQTLELGGLVLAKGTPVFLSPYVTQRDERWFEDPGAFRPERWAEPAPDRPRFAWFPFGAGPRSCIGEHFARSVMMLIVATIAQRWRLRALGRTLPRPRSLLTLKPRGAVWMVAESAPPAGIS
jgi:cytochrome P450